MYKGEQMWSVAQYNSNNSWLYNYNNGCLNNNNKYNSYTCRPLDYIDLTNFGKDEFKSLLIKFLESYKECCRKKGNKPSHREFLWNISERLVTLTASVLNRTYIPSESICFIITYPKPREVIAPNFVDRVLQTFYVNAVEPYFESRWFLDSSYSCRKGKGGLRAMLYLFDLIRTETDNYTSKNTVLVKRDLKSFFPSIDPKVVTRIVTGFLEREYPDGYMKELLLYLTKAIYLSYPQKNCRYQGDPGLLNLLNENKRIMGKDIGLPIGNRTSQLAANIITTPYLMLLTELGYKFVHYTDDTVIIVHDYEKWRRDEKTIEEFISQELHLLWHPDKKYVQHYTKGVEFLGFKIKRDRILPGDRVAHNFLWSVKREIAKSCDSKYFCADKEHFMQTVNSYTGLLKWAESNRLLCKAFDDMMSSNMEEYYDFVPLEKIEVKENKTKKSRQQLINKQKKRNLRCRELKKQKERQHEINEQCNA